MTMLVDPAQKNRTPAHHAAQIESLYAHHPIKHTSGGTAYRSLSDDFIEMLSFINAGMLNRGNLLCMDYAIRNLPSAGPIVEIGSFAGLSTNLLRHFCRKHGADNAIINCDPWDLYETPGHIGGDDDGGAHLSFGTYRRYVLDSFKRNQQMFSHDRLPNSIQSFSDDFFAAWDRGDTIVDLFGSSTLLGGPIAFAYIDGDHTYAQSRRDFLNVDRHLVPGGMILFDDSGDGSKWETTRVIDEIKQRDDYTVVIANPNYLVQKTR